MLNTYAFLFSSSYDESALVAVVTALLDQANRPTVILRAGTMLLHRLARYTSEIALSPKGTGKHPKNRTNSETESFDRYLFQTLAYDLIACVREQWHTTDEELFTGGLLRHEVEVLTCQGLPRSDAAILDAKLRSHESYIGCVELDLGNPIQRTALITYLVAIAIVVDKQVIVPYVAPDHQVAPSWATQIRECVPQAINDWEFDERSAVRFPDDLSERGKRTAEIFKKRLRRTSQRLLVQAANEMRRTHDLNVEVVVGLPPSTGVEDVRIEPAKMLQYILSSEHATGRHKARVFKTALGFDVSNWRYLAAQLIDGLGKVTVKARIDQYGAHHSADIPVVGISGQTAVVRTGWIAHRSEPPRLVTAYVLDASTEPSIPPAAPPVLTTSPTSASDWQRVYELATAEASAVAANLVPTPMKIHGGEWVEEGECGYAWVVLPDARHPFIRWAKKNGKGHRNHPKGWAFSADVNSQSVERARAYALTFAHILALNGIESYVESRYD